MEWDEKMTLEEKSKLGDAFGAYVIVEGENEGDVRDDSGDEFKFEVSADEQIRSLPVDGMI